MALLRRRPERGGGTGRRSAGYATGIFSMMVSRGRETDRGREGVLARRGFRLCALGPRRD